MNIIEKQAELGKSLYEINTTTMKQFVSLQRENLEQYFETNREFGTRLPEVKDLNSAMELQREYSETLVKNAREAIEAQNELMAHAFNETKEVIQSAFSQEDAVVAPAVKTAVKAAKKAAPKAKAKAKAKAKKAA